MLGEFGDYGLGVPRNTGGLIGDAERDAINKRALLSGGINAALTYFATPKNLNLGSSVPYLAKAGLAGFGASQNTVDQALNNVYRQKLLAGKEDNIRTYEKDRQKITEQFDPITKKWTTLGTSSLDAPKADKTNIGSVDPSKFTVESLNTFATSGKYSDLKPLKSPTEGLGLKDIYGAPEKDINGNLIYVPKVPGQPFRDMSGKPIAGNVQLQDKGGEKLTEGERTAGFLSTRLNNSLKQLQAVTGQEPTAASPNIGAEATKFFTRSDYLKNLANPESRQQVEAAQYDILDSALTLGTGAAYTREQLESYRQSYFPQLGDKDKTIEDKATRLQGLLDAAYEKAGRAAPKDTKPGIKTKTVVRTGKDKLGKKVIEYSDGSIGYGD